MRFLHTSLGLSLVTLSFAGCSDPEPEPVIPQDIFADLGAVRPSATSAQRATFERGRRIALRRFTPEEGLGPVFNVSACADCHERPTVGGSAGRYRNFLLLGQRLPDGSFTPTGTNGVQDQYSLVTGREASPARTNVTATRHPIPFFGVGLLAEIPGAEILSRADPDDRNGDGISGRANYDRGFVGRFGRKSQNVSIEGFIRGPIFNHSGITSNPLPDRLKALLPVPSATTTGSVRQALTGDDTVGRVAQAQVAAPDEPTTDDDGVRDPELGEQDLFDLVSFAMLTAAPRPDDPTPATAQGRAIFDRIGCAACHTPALRGPRGLIPAYSDLLLHDMGAALADGIEMKNATGSEFRTQPLWGVVATGPWLHDGRADTLAEAITMHGGEAVRSRDAFVALPEGEKGRVIAFLESLGGRSQYTEGLLPPDAPVPAAGAYGGPVSGLGASDLARFERGRRRYDGDFGYGQGLGPAFNGDACRACHFDPVVGGAGPLGVDVTRQAILDPMTGVFTEPTGGTMAHHHGAFDTRPALDARSNFFEVRQTPHTFGLGLIDRIPESAIVANADPTDSNRDGIAGRVRRLPDGRIGRFGWKAGVPSVREFVRDALSNELGMTVPTVAGETFGNMTDNDRVADPETTPETLGDIAFFIASLAPPPRTRTDAAQEDLGEAVFNRVGCAVCHRPSLPDDQGRPVALYSDLLLHDVAADGARGVADADVSAREFRTAPLWGIARSAPYMHDGRASTVEAAIAAHHREGEGSSRAVSALSAGDRAALVAFLRSL